MPKREDEDDIVSNTPSPGFLFYQNQSGDQPMSRSALDTRRKIAETLAARSKKYPKNIGEGLSSFGESVYEAMAMKKLQQQEQEYTKGVRADVNEATSAPGRQAMPVGPRAAIEAAPLAPVASATPDRTMLSSDPATLALLNQSDPALDNVPPTDNFNDRWAGYGGSAQPAIAEAPADFGPRFAASQPAATPDRRAVITQAINAVRGPEANPLQPLAAAQPPSQDQILAEVTGQQRFPATASLGRAGVASDAPAIGLNPMGAVGGLDASVNDRRNSITGTLADQPTVAPEVPQPNPTQTAVPPPSISPPSTPSTSNPGPSSPPVRMAQLAPGASAPVLDASMFSSTPVGQQPPAPTSQGIGKAPSARRDPGEVPWREWKLPDEPKPPDIPPRSERELKAIRLKMLRPDDPDVGRIADTIIGLESDLRSKQYEREVEKYKKKMDLHNIMYPKAQEGIVGEPERRQKFRAGEQKYDTDEQALAKARLDYTKEQQTILTPGSTAQPPDPHIGTPRSRQRTGIPTPDPKPPNMSEQKWSELQGPELAKIAPAVDKGEPELRESLALIDLARKHPGQKWGTGATGAFARERAGTAAYEFGAINKQIKAKTFMAGYETLKGGGAIGEKEGEKGEAARANVDPDQGPDAYVASLNRLEGTLRSALEQAQRRAKRPVTAWQKTPDDDYAPDIGEIGKRGKYTVEYLGGDPNDDRSYRRVKP